jgi:ABC-2 type transport system ATP-binding protein
MVLEEEMNQKAIQVENLQKHYGNFVAVRGVNFDVDQGEIFSLLGPNGAGKSTTISILSCLPQPTAGDACIIGHSIVREPQEVKAKIGIVPQDIALYGDVCPGKPYILGPHVWSERQGSD